MKAIQKEFVFFLRAGIPHGLLCGYGHLLRSQIPFSLMTLDFDIRFIFCGMIETWLQHCCFSAFFLLKVLPLMIYLRRKKSGTTFRERETLKW